MKRPMIALTVRDKTENGNRTFLNNDSYFDYIENAGGFPVNVKAYSPEEAAQAAETFDGLVITGGGDIDPKKYGSDYVCETTPEDIEASDFMLYDAFKKAGKPVLGICRGIQVITVAEGAPLIEDIPTFNGNQHNQRDTDPPVERSMPLHECTFVNDTVIHRIFGDRHGVNSYHHQASRELPAGFTLAAVSYDGIIEAYENEKTLAVQWHPERMITDDAHQELARVFVNMCRE